MGATSRTKGKRVERQAAEAIRAVLGVEARRSVQYSGVAGTADLTTEIPGLHVEVKGRNAIAALRYMDQARADSAKTGTVPVVLMREDFDPEFFVLCRLSDVPALLECLTSLRTG